MSQTRIPDSLERIFLSRGWYNVYINHIPDLQQPNASNEMYARCPFRDIVDNNASFSVNAQTGLFSCFRTGRSGNYIQFRQWTDAPAMGPDGFLIPLDFRMAQEIVMREEGIVAPEESWIQQCHINLAHSPETIAWIQQFKPWFLSSIATLQIGYDWETSCIVIPIRDNAGKLINAKLYNPNGQPKMRWKVNGLSANVIFPHFSILNNEDNLILVEGETDVITLRGLGFNAVSGTVGASSILPAGDWFRARNVRILTDEDVAGERARQTAINAIQSTATETKSIRIPEWENRPETADISDYVRYLFSIGESLNDIILSIQELIDRGEIVASINSAFNAEPVPVSFSQILNSERVNERIEFIAKVSAKSERRYIGLTRYGLSCPGRGFNFCNRCPMSLRWNGNAEFFLDRRSHHQLKLISTPDAKRVEAMKEINGIPSQCPEVTVTPLEWAGYEPTQISASISEHSDNEISGLERYRREAFFIVQNGIRVEENRDYSFTGFLYPDPKSQSGLIVIDTAKPLATTAELFKMDEEISKRLSIFKPKKENDLQSVKQMLFERGNDLADSVTGIKGRLDLHLAMSLVWHSAINFHYGEQIIDRGWLEIFVIGDTRTGKSVTFRQLAKHYGIGTWADCKNISIAGLLGSVNSSSATGERYVTAGLLPQNDKGVVGLDEMEGAKFGRITMLEGLASMRSEGIVRITKAAQAQYRARVRKICMANPGKGLLIAETGKTGAQLILEMIPQPENIARFDAALCVSQEDVLAELINQSEGLSIPKWDTDSQKLLLNWIYSRKSNQINFTPEAQEKVREIANLMCKKYDSTLPIVESSDQKTKIAKWAVAIAGFCFSSTNNDEDILVLESHVLTAYELLNFFYEKPVMSYHTFSSEKKQRRILQDEPQVRDTLNTMQEDKYKFAELLLKMDEINEKSLRNIVNGPMATQILKNLISNNCIHLIQGGRRDTAYEKNPTFTVWLKLFIKEQNKEAGKK